MLFGSQRKEVTILFIFSLLGYISYCSNLVGHLLFDDIRFTIENSAIHWSTYSWDNLLNLSKAVGFYSRPVTILSFALTYPIGNGSLVSYHIVSIFTHIGVGYFLFLVTKQLFLLDKFRLVSKNNANLIACISALIWLVHPLNSQPVNYIIQRSVLLSTFFYLLALIYYIKLRVAIRERRKSTIDYIIYLVIMLGAFILAMGSKATAVTFPPVCLLIELMFFHHLTVKKTLRLIAIIVILGVGLLTIYSIWRGNLLAVINQNYNFIEGDIPRCQHFLTGCRAVFVYLKNFLWPDINQLRLEYSFPVSTSLFAPLSTLLSLSAIIAALVVAFRQFYKNSLVSFTILFFLGNLVLETFIIKLDLIYEHRAYLPTLFIAMIIVAGLYRSKGVDKSKVTLLLSFVIILFTLLTHHHSKVWNTPLSVFEHNIRLSPKHDRVVLNYFSQRISTWVPGVNDIELELVQTTEKAVVKRLKKQPKSVNDNLVMSYICLLKKQFVDADKWFRAGLENCSGDRLKKSFLMAQLTKLRGLKQYHYAINLIDAYNQLTVGELSFELEYGFNCILSGQSNKVDKRIQSMNLSRKELVVLYKQLGGFSVRIKNKEVANKFLDLYRQLKSPE